MPSWGAHRHAVPWPTLLQRLGRAGRVRPGKCLCLYTRDRFESHMRRYSVPEISRVPLEELLLQVKKGGGGGLGSRGEGE
jgi:HrpA-like RNA helicase